MKRAFEIWVLVLSWILSALCYVTGAFNLTVIVSFISYLIFTHLILKFSGLNSLSFIFLILFGLYGYSVPLSVLFGADIGEYRLKDLLTWFEVTDSLYSFVLINHLALLGMIAAFILNLRNIRVKPEEEPLNVKYNENLRNFSYLVALISGLFETLNFIRAGGFDTIAQGKLIYQSAISDLTPTLPSEIFLYLSIIIWVLSNPKFNLIEIIRILLFNGIYLVFNLFIGERGLFVSLFILLFFGITYSIKITKIKIGFALGFTVIYVLILSLTLYRNIFDLGLGNTINFPIVKEYLTDNKSKMLFIINPANSEYGTSCMNYRVYYELNDDNPKFGKTYIDFYSQLLPVRINPFNKESVINEFRNKYFPERSINGETGGTAFSSLMEAYINFREVGGLLIYLIVYLLLLKLEDLRYNSGSNHIKNLYLILGPLVLLFHRSAFEYLAYSFIQTVIILFVLLSLYNTMIYVFTFHNNSITKTY